MSDDDDDDDDVKHNKIKHCMNSRHLALESCMATNITWFI